MYCFICCNDESRLNGFTKKIQSNAGYTVADVQFPSVSSEESLVQSNCYCFVSHFGKRCVSFDIFPC